ncbi:MAG TPA: hypothetical protein VGV92_05230 [Gammaproteobacteria bacterium]|nr:hypothetical protein [Gammaproteobacteria bacterium]
MQQEGDSQVVQAVVQENSLTQQTSPGISDRIYLHAAKFVAKLLTEGPSDHTPLLKALRAYKAIKDESTGNDRKTTSDFLEKVLLALSGKFNIGTLAPDSYKFLGQIGEKEKAVLGGVHLSSQDGLFYAYNLFAVLKHILRAQKNTKDGKACSSSFIVMLLETLSPIFAQGNVQLNESLRVFGSKKKAALKRGKLEDLAVLAEENFLGVFAMENKSIQQCMDANAPDAVQKLFDYCAIKEDDSISKKRPEKRTKVYDILASYFMATTAEDFIGVFKAVQEGIQSSRAEGGNGVKSRGMEFALVAFRDWLYYTLFINEESNHLVKFTPEQLSTLLSYMSYFNMKIERQDKPAIFDSEVSQYAIHLIGLLSDKTKEEKVVLQIQLIARLVLTLPDVINGQKIKIPMKAKMLYEKGIFWAEAMTALLKDTSLTPEQRKEIAVLGFIWNRCMAELGVNDPQYYVPQIYVGFDVIKDHPLAQPNIEGSNVPKQELLAFKNELTIFCQSSIARVQAILAPRLLRQLHEEEKSLANPQEKSVIGTIEALILEGKYEDAIASIKKNLDIELVLDKKERMSRYAKLGPRWAQAITDLLKRKESLSLEQCSEVAAYGFVWNKCMLDSGETNPQCFTLQHLVSFEDIKKDPLLAKKGFSLMRKKDPVLEEARTALEYACEGSAARIFHAQAVLAPKHPHQSLSKTLSVVMNLGGEEEFEEGAGFEVEAEEGADEQSHVRLGVSADALNSPGSSAMYSPKRTSGGNPVAVAAVVTAAITTNDAPPALPPRDSSSGDEQEAPSSDEATKQKASSPRMGRGSGSGDNN